MPDIAIEQSTFKRLRRHARLLVDTTDAARNRVLDTLELQAGRADLKEDSAVVERLIDPNHRSAFFMSRPLSTVGDLRRRSSIPVKGISREPIGSNRD